MSLKKVVSSTWVRLTVSLGLIALLLWITDVHLIVDTLALAKPVWLMAALVMVMILTVFGAVKWWVLMLRSRSSPLTFIRVNFVSNFVGIFFPGIVGIEAARITGVARSSRDLPAAFSSVLVDRLFGLVSLGLMVSLGGVVAYKFVPKIITLSCLILLFSLGVGVFLIMHQRFRQLISGILPSRIDSAVVKLYECLDLYRGRTGTLALSLALSVTFQLLRVIMVYFLTLSLSISVDFQYLLIVVPIALFVQMLPISVYGIGVRESVMISMLAVVGVSSESSFALSILMLAVQIVGAFPGGILLALGFKLQTPDKALAESAQD